MRTLILSCNTGEGHNSCSKAIKEYYDQLGEACVIEDALSFISESASKFISNWHVRIYRYMPGLFRFGYRYSEKHPGVFHENSSVYRLLTLGTERMYQYIVDGGYDAVICTHVFSSLMLTDILKKYPIKLATCFVATDYTCSPSTKDSNLDFYFIPDECLKSDFESPNITADKMIDSGVPVRQMFYSSLSMEEAKGRMQISPASKHLLIMCGSMGCGPMNRMVKSLSEQMKDEWNITVVCGTNQRLQKKLDKQYALSSNIHIQGYVKDVSVLMDSADLYLTKPGGISVSEAAVKNLPMVFIDAVAGCEEYNRIHFIRNGGAKTGSTIEELTRVCLTLMDQDSTRQQMKEKLNDIESSNASQIIHDRMQEKILQLTNQL